MTSTSRFRKIRSAHPYRVNLAAVKNLANRFAKTKLVSSPRSPPSVFDDIIRLCALHCSTITHVCDHITSPDYPSLNTVHRKLVLLDVHSVVEVINSLTLSPMLNGSGSFLRRKWTLPLTVLTCPTAETPTLWVWWVASRRRVRAGSSGSQRSALSRMGIDSHLECYQWISSRRPT